jgi:predicted DNA-binding transcriptional regulator AlpA
MRDSGHKHIPYVLWNQLPPSMQDLDKCLTPAEFGEKWNMSRATVYRRLAAGTIPGAYRLAPAGKIFIDPDSEPVFAPLPGAARRKCSRPKDRDLAR